jgi:adiponectin receptor
MTTSEFKKRHIQGVSPNTANAATNQRGPIAQTVTWDEIHEWQRDNKYIRRGYRPGTANFLEILTSLTFVHNETCNVYTHLIGALLLPLLATTYMQLLSESQFSGVTRADYFMFGLFFWTAECCLVISTLYHLNISHSENGEQFWLRMDLLRIIIVIEGTHISGINYIFPCEPRWQRTYWTTVSSLPVTSLYLSTG